MQNMSFALTIPQILDKSKVVTRRIGWANLRSGHVLRPVEKAMGLKKGEKIQQIGGLIQVTSVKREVLSQMINDVHYGNCECLLEGFPDLTPEQFVHMFSRTNRCSPNTVITRIQFCYE